MVRIKKNDVVEVIAGKDKGKKGKVLKVDREKNRVFVEGCNLVKKTLKPTRGSNEKGKGLIEIEASLNLSNVMLLDQKGKTTRIGVMKTDDHKKIYYNKTTGEKRG